MPAYEINRGTNIHINLMYHIIHTLVNNLTLAQVWNCQEQLAIFPNEDIDISKMLPNVVSALDLRIPPEVPSATHAQDILQQLWKEWPENIIGIPGTAPEDYVTPQNWTAGSPEAWHHHF